ncbi:unnamed protein product, partial [Didymodactylos carnosus]
LLCYFHIVKKLKEHIAKLPININQKKEILDWSKKLIYSQNQAEFDNHAYNLRQTALNTTYWTYFEQNWMTCTNLWVFFKRKDSLSLLNNTNNRIESFYRVVKREFRRRNKIPHLSEALNILMMLFNLKTHIQDFENVRQELTSFTIQNTKYPEFMKECGHVLTVPILQSTSNKNDNQKNTLNNGFESSGDDDCAVQSNDNSCCLTVAEKNRLAWNEFHMINNYLTQLGTTEFYERLDDLKNLFISWTEKQQLKKQAENETQTSLTTSPEKRHVNNVVPLFTITRVVHPRGRPKQTKRHTSFYKRITSVKPSSKTKIKRLQGRPLSSTLKNLLMNSNVDLAPMPSIAPSPNEPLIDNNDITHSQQSVSSNSSSKVTRSVAEAAVATITLSPRSLPSQSFNNFLLVSTENENKIELNSAINLNLNALEENENIMNLNTSDNQNHRQQEQLPSIPLPPTVITHDVNTTDDEAKENLCIITEEIIFKKMLFDPPTKEWIMKQLTDLKLIRTRSNLPSIVIPKYGVQRDITINSRPVIIKDIKSDGNCLFR